MQIVIYRTRKNRLYTEGELVINDDRQTFTVEATDTMLPAGNYLLSIVKKSERKQTLAIFRTDGTPTGWSIGIGSSFINSRKEQLIAIGNRLIPGALYKATHDYERLTDRFSKCLGRGEQIELEISDRFCRQNEPIKHWISIFLAVFSVLILSSCTTCRKVQIVEHATHDTLYLNRVQYDSVYIYQNVLTDRLHDTIYIHDLKREYKYKVLRDTMFVHQVDSIPVIKEVEVVKTKRETPWIYKAALWFSIAVIVIVLVIVAIRVIRLIVARK